MNQRMLASVFCGIGAILVGIGSGNWYYAGASFFFGSIVVWTVKP